MELQSLLNVLQQSMKDKRGVTFFLPGHSVAGLVTKADLEFVEAKSQTYSRILIRIDQIMAVAIA